MLLLAAAGAAKNEPRLFYRPSGHPMVNRSFSSHYYDYPMGRVQREAGKEWKKKHGFIPLSGVSRSYLPAYLSSSPALVSSRNPTKCIAQATKSNFSLLSTLLRTTLYPCLEREVARAMRHMPSPLVVRVCKFRRCIVSTGCPLLCFSPPPLLSVSTKDPGQTFIRLGIFIF